MPILAVDIGGSGSRALLRDAEVHTASGGPRQIASDSVDIADALDSLAIQLPRIKGDFEVISVGLASLIAFGDPAELIAEVRRRWRCRHVVLASDAVMAVAAAWGAGGGAVVAAGTGAVGFSTDFAQRWIRADGWGHQIGDAGGGAWIGTRGLQAALREADGRSGGSPALLKRAETVFGATADIASAISGSRSAARTLASFVPAVAEAAREGDAIAESIIVAAGRELAITGEAVVAGASHPRVALVGGLTAVAPLVRSFEAALQQRMPGVHVTSRTDDPVAGALVLAEAVAARKRTTSHPPYLYLDGPI